MRSGFAFLTEGMETRGIQLALTSKSVYSHSRSVSPLMADQSTPPGEKQQFLWATRADVACTTPQNVGPCDGSGGRLETNCKIAAVTLFLCLHSELNSMWITSAHVCHSELVIPDMPMEKLYLLRVFGWCLGLMAWFLTRVLAQSSLTQVLLAFPFWGGFQFQEIRPVG